MPGERRRVAAFCPLCVSRCGCEAVVEDGRLVAIEPDPSHPTGKALCAKGRASPELVEATDRLLHPMRRTRPKGDADPGWQRITWDQALNETATAMRRIAAESGPEALAFAVTTPSGTAISDAAPCLIFLVPRARVGLKNQTTPATPITTAPGLTRVRWVAIVAPVSD